MARPCFVYVCAVALALLVTPFSMAQSAAAAAPKPLAAKAPLTPAPNVISYGQTAPQRRIEAVLNAPLKRPIQFVETPISMVATELAESYDIPIVFDNETLDAAGTSPEAEVSVNIANTSLKTALQLILGTARFKGLGLTYIVDGEVVLITTQDEASNHLERRIYPVDRLLAALRAGQPATAAAQDGDVKVDDLTELSDALALTISPQTWRRSGAGQGDVQKIGDRYLVVLQTQSVHEEIEAFLKHLAAAAASEATVPH